MNKPELQKMIDMLEEVQAGTWTPDTGPHKAASFDLDVWGCATDCGFSACAIGHAALDDRFEWLAMEQVTSVGDMVVVISGDRFEYLWGGIAENFGISLDVANSLFAPRYYSDSQDVSEVIRRLNKVITGGLA